MRNSLLNTQGAKLLCALCVLKCTVVIGDAITPQLALQLIMHSHLLCMHGSSDVENFSSDSWPTLVPFHNIKTSSVMETYTHTQTLYILFIRVENMARDAWRRLEISQMFQ